MDACPVNTWAFTENENPQFELTLEWIVGSPPAFHNFEELPIIKDTTVRNS
jgi:heme/copper-type cytochrome/quinol oxidase subunit 1